MAKKPSEKATAAPAVHLKEAEKDLDLVLAMHAAQKKLVQQAPVAGWPALQAMVEQKEKKIIADHLASLQYILTNLAKHNSPDAVAIICKVLNCDCTPYRLLAIEFLATMSIPAAEDAIAERLSFFSLATEEEKERCRKLLDDDRVRQVKRENITTSFVGFPTFFGVLAVLLFVVWGRLLASLGTWPKIGLSVFALVIAGVAAVSLFRLAMAAVNRMVDKSTAQRASHRRKSEHPIDNRERLQKLAAEMQALPEPSDLLARAKVSLLKVQAMALLNLPEVKADIDQLQSALAACGQTIDTSVGLASELSKHIKILRDMLAIVTEIIEERRNASEEAAEAADQDEIPLDEEDEEDDALDAFLNGLP